MKYENRLIAFFDVLGFAKLLEEKNIDELYKLYKRFIQEIKSEVFQPQETMKGSQEQEVLILQRFINLKDNKIGVAVQF